MTGDAEERVSAVGGDQSPERDEAVLSPHTAHRCGNGCSAYERSLTNGLKTVQPFAVVLSPGCLAVAGARPSLTAPVPPFGFAVKRLTLPALQ